MKASPDHKIRTQLQRLYTAEDKAAVRFRYGLLAFDLLIMAFLVVSSFFYGNPIIEILDVFVGLVVFVDVLARFWISKSRVAFVLSPYGLADMLTVISLLLPLLGENLAFLRVIRMFRLFRSYEVVKRLRGDFAYFRRHEDIILSALNLLLFLFVMTALVYETQVGHNEKIGNYIDALYFTVTTLTTTGFGDITLVGDSGKLIAVIIMIFGVSLFIRLIQMIFRPNKVKFPCPDCGLYMHERDAVHCKHCGNMLNLPDEGLN